jgi:hypothetical protein
MAMTANTKIFYSTINQAALDQPASILFEDPQALVSLCIYCLNGTQNRREERTPRENENDRRPRPYTADFEVVLSDGLIGAVSGGLNL